MLAANGERGTPHFRSCDRQPHLTVGEKGIRKHMEI